MKKTSLILFLATLLLSASPRLIVPEPTADFGIVSPGVRVLKHEYKLINVGSDTLRISQVRAGCSCTILEIDSLIPPGQTSTIKSGLEITHNGNYAKTIRITSNCPENPITTLRQLAFVLDEIMVGPSYMMMRERDGAFSERVNITSKVSQLEVESVVYKPRGADSVNIIPVQFELEKLPEFDHKAIKELLSLSQDFIAERDSALQKHLGPAYYKEPFIRYEKQLRDSNAPKNKIEDLLKRYQKLTELYFQTLPYMATQENSIINRRRELERIYSGGAGRYHLYISFLNEINNSQAGTIVISIKSPIEREETIPVILEQQR